MALSKAIIGTTILFGVTQVSFALCPDQYKGGARKVICGVSSVLRVPAHVAASLLTCSTENLKGIMGRPVPEYVVDQLKKQKQEREAKREADDKSKETGTKDSVLFGKDPVIPLFVSAALIASSYFLGLSSMVTIPLVTGSFVFTSFLTQVGLDLTLQFVSDFKKPLLFLGSCMLAPQLPSLLQIRPLVAATLPAAVLTWWFGGVFTTLDSLSHIGIHLLSIPSSAVCTCTQFYNITNRTTAIYVRTEDLIWNRLRRTCKFLVNNNDHYSSLSTAWNYGEQNVWKDVIERSLDVCNYNVYTYNPKFKRCSDVFAFNLVHS